MLWTGDWDSLGESLFLQGRLCSLPTFIRRRSLNAEKIESFLMAQEGTPYTDGAKGLQT